MRMLGYYAWHTFINQIRKLLKSWVIAFILICGLMGGLIGFGAATLFDTTELEESIDGAATPEDAGMNEGEAGAYEGAITDNPEDFLNPDQAGQTDQAGLDGQNDPAAMNEAAEDDWEEYEDDEPLSEEDAALMRNILELIIGALILVVFVYVILSADKNASAIFLPADVNLLFSSPMKPQSVLMFRLVLQMGTMLVASVYLLFQIPNLMENLDMGLPEILILVVIWVATLIFSKLVQVAVYLLGASYSWLKPRIRPALYAVLLLTAGGLAAYRSVTGLPWMDAVIGYFNSPVSRMVPVWGWLKGLYAAGSAGSWAMAALYAVLLVAAAILLGWWISTRKVDFYEEAMAKSEERADMIRAAQESGRLYASTKPKKDRSEQITRDGIRHGWGASVFFFKPLYNRFRFARFHFLTKTMETYLVATAGTLFVLKVIVGTESTSIMPVALVLAGLIFFRTLGNPLQEDTRMDFFRLIPESMFAKVWYSLLSGLANCFLDILPGMVIAAVVLKASPLSVAAWMLFVLSVDFYSTNVGSFIDVSLPGGTGTTIKQLVQILFLYFGLLPDIVIIAVGFVTESLTTALPIAAAVNIGLGLVFFLLISVWMEPSGGRPVRTGAVDEETIRQGAKAYSRAGIAALVFLGAASIVQIAAGALIAAVAPWILEESWGVWILTFVPVYLIGFPLGVLILKKIPAHPSEQTSWSAGMILKTACITVFMMLIGNLVGNAVNMALLRLTGATDPNAVADLAGMDGIFFQILVMVILAPTVEEFFFRRLLIDRLRIYGEELAVFSTALMFGLFHGNTSQMFYAFTIGLVLGYVYLRTGKLRYTIGLHMGINLFSGVLATKLLERAMETMNQIAEGAIDMGNGVSVAAGSGGLPIEMILFIAYILILLGAAIAGLVFFILNVKKLRFYPAEAEIPTGRRFRSSWGTVGMILFTLACLALVVVSIIGL